MPKFRPFVPWWLLLATACQTYSAAPVDLPAHAAAFAARLPDSDEVRAFVAELAKTTPNAALTLQDGISLAEGHLLALLFHPDCRLARQRAGVALATADNAGRWTDPVLGGSVERILESVQNPWLVAGSLGFSLPLTGRPGLQKELALSEHQEALLEARLTELHVLDQLDARWLGWSAAQRRADLLRELCRRLDELVAIADRLQSAHELTALEARAFRLERQTRGHELAVAEAAAASGELDCKALLGLHPTAPVLLQPALITPPRWAEAAPPRDLLATSPRLARLQRAHDTAERHLALAIRKQWPDLVLSPGFAEEDGLPRATLGFSLPLPLFSGNQGEIQTATAARELAAEALRCGYEQQVAALARAELQERLAIDQRDTIASQLLPLAALQVEDAQKLAELGRLDTLLILDALVRAHQAKLLAIDTTLAAAEARVATQSLFWPDLLPFATALPDRTTPEQAR